ncbi:MAG: acyl carrier protein [Thermoguttaceae bacterium]
MASIEERVINIIAEQMNVEKSQINRDTDIANDLGADSLDLAEMMIMFEEEFDIDIVEEEAQSITTVGQVIDQIQKNVKS